MVSACYLHYLNQAVRRHSCWTTYKGMYRESRFRVSAWLLMSYWVPSGMRINRSVACLKARIPKLVRSLLLLTERSNPPHKCAVTISSVLQTPCFNMDNRSEKICQISRVLSKTNFPALFRAVKSWKMSVLDCAISSQRLSIFLGLDGGLGGTPSLLATPPIPPVITIKLQLFNRAAALVQAAIKNILPVLCRCAIRILHSITAFGNVGIVRV